MAGKRKGCCGCLVGLGLIVAVALAGLAILIVGVMPTPGHPAEFVRFEKPVSLSTALKALEKKSVVKNAWAATMFAKLTRTGGDVKAGTYKVKAGSTIEDVLSSLKKPYSQMVRLPEGWWIKRTAKRLEDQGVCSVDDYLKATSDPKTYSDLGLNLPKDGLEGYLFPDTYDLPPLTPPESIVRLQLQTFKKRVAGSVPKTVNLKRALIVASMVELEAGKDSERARIAGVIDNRLKKGMALEIDATVLYALQEWKNLPPGVVRTVQSPYNTYLHKGLPPGPIGSPGLKSIQAALKPEKHGYLYYVARPDRSHYFTSDYPTHLQNIRKARAEWRAAGGP
jgi:UPF0755 protein